jgi:hypothetical protein
VIHRDERILALLPFAVGSVDQRVEVPPDAELPAFGPGQLLDLAVELLPERGRVGPRALQQIEQDSPVLVGQRPQEVRRRELGMARAASLLRGLLQGLADLGRHLLGLHAQTP